MLVDSDLPICNIAQYIVVAQRKRIGPITQGSVDRNNPTIILRYKKNGIYSLKYIQFLPLKYIDEQHSHCREFNTWLLLLL